MDITINERYFLRAETDSTYTIIDTEMGAVVEGGFETEHQAVSYLVGCYEVGSEELEQLLSEYPSVRDELQQAKERIAYKIEKGKRTGKV